jgi:hypothetical protein
MGYAASLYNMMRNTGSAIGISLVTNLLNSREQMHQAYLSLERGGFELAVPRRIYSREKGREAARSLAG